MIEREYRQQRLIPAFMEPRSMVVDPTGEQMTVWSSTQVPHILRFLLAATMGISESKIRVIAPDVGGGFGGKLQMTPEECVTIARGPSRSASRSSTPRPAPSRCCRATTAATSGRSSPSPRTKDGTVTGLKVDLLADMGAYIGLVGGGVPVLGAWMFNAIYKFPAYQFTVHDRAAPTRPGSTPTAAPADPRRRTPSSG